MCPHAHTGVLCLCSHLGRKHDLFIALSASGGKPRYNSYLSNCAIDILLVSCLYPGERVFVSEVVVFAGSCTLNVDLRRILSNPSRVCQSVCFKVAVNTSAIHKPCQSELTLSFKPFLICLCAWARVCVCFARARRAITRSSGIQGFH